MGSPCVYNLILTATNDFITLLRYFAYSINIHFIFTISNY